MTQNCYRHKQQSRIDTENSYKLIQEGIAVNFYSKLPRRYDEKLSTARILDLSLCWTLEMNPRKKWRLRVRALWKRRSGECLLLRKLGYERWSGRRLMEISLSTNTSTISRMPRAVRCDYIQRVKVFRKI